MGKEIERKYLVEGMDWRRLAEGVLYRQGYLSSAPQRNVRVRIAGDKATLTIKGPPKGMGRPEFEYEIPMADAREMLELCERPLIEKQRYRIAHDGMTWEVDEFSGENQGLVVAEIELQSEQQEFTKPTWIGREVTQDPRYLNANLIRRPFKDWKD